MAVGLLASAFSFISASDETNSPLTARQLYYKSRPKAATRPPSSGIKPKPEGASTKPLDADISKVDQSKAAVLEPDAEPTNLALRYSLIDGDTLQEIDPAKVFRSGDHIRMKLQANSNGYLYILNQDPLGGWTTLFPSADIVQNDNRVERGRVTEVPSGQNFEFDNVPGVEKLFIVFSRDREPDLDALIESMKRAQPDRKSDAASGRLLQARNRIPASEIDRLRSARLASRGIRVQPVRTSSGAAENAVYVASGDQSSPRVVTEVVLRHE